MCRRWLRCIDTNVWECNCSTECSIEDECEDVLENLCKCLCKKGCCDQDDCCS